MQHIKKFVELKAAHANKKVRDGKKTRKCDGTRGTKGRYNEQFHNSPRLKGNF